MVTDNQSTDHISIEDGNEEAWICLCRNTPSAEGFYPCNRSGTLTEEDDYDVAAQGPWEGLFRCDRCGRIIDGDTRAVVGRDPLHPGYTDPDTPHG